MLLVQRRAFRLLQQVGVRRRRPVVVRCLPVRALPERVGAGHLSVADDRVRPTGQPGVVDQPPGVGGRCHA